MRWSPRARLLAIVTVCVAVDQLTKWIARGTLRGEPSHSYLGGVLRLIYAENPGVAISLGANLPPTLRFWLLTVGVGVVLVFLAIFVWRRPHAGATFLWGGALTLGGGIGNLIDRFANDGRVVDFLLLTAGPLRTAIFNVADMLIVAGVILLVFARHDEPIDEPKVEANETGDPVPEEQGPQTPIPS